MSEASYNMIKAAEAGDTDKVIHYFTAKGVDKNTRNNYGVRLVNFIKQLTLLLLLCFKYLYFIVQLFLLRIMDI